MKIDCDKIIFEDLEEVECLLDVLDKYSEQNPEDTSNKTIKRFYDLLDVMEMSW